MFFESLRRSIQAFNFHEDEINWLDREQAKKAAENRQLSPWRHCGELATGRESPEFLDFFQSPK